MAKTLRHVHFVAIGGTGMGSLAGLLKARGLEVTGSDAGLYPPMSTLLEGWGIPVHEGFRAENVLARPPDLVVIGNAVRPENPEARAAIDEELPYASFPDALYQLAIAGRHPIVVTGTHGKTTTTSLVASALLALGLDPSALVAGHSLDLGGPFREGQGDHFVVEGDEYDTAFFDKTPKFLHYGARTVILTSVEFDHADIYPDLEAVKAQFRKLVSGLPADGRVVAALGNAGVREVVAHASCPVVGYGLEGDEGAHGAAWEARSVSAGPDGTSFDVARRGEVVGRARVPLFGACNVENALAAIATACELGVEPSRAAGSLAGFRGVKRRQEIRGEAGGVTVVDDFAHHPTAVRASIDALRARFPGRRLVAVFEPRTNTSRRAVFQDDYARSFDAADAVVLSVVPHTAIYSATGEVTEYLDCEQLAGAIAGRGTPARAVDGVEAIVAELAANAREGDVVLVMSNGDFGGIWEKLLAALGGPGGIPKS